MHCLNTLLPSKKIIDYLLRNSDTSYVLPQCSLSILNVLLLCGLFLYYRYITIVTQVLSLSFPLSLVIMHVCCVVF